MDEDICSICLDNFDNSYALLKCGHKFHSSCLFKNFTRRIECPLCRKELVEPNIDSDEDSDQDSDEDSE